MSGLKWIDDAMSEWYATHQLEYIKSIIHLIMFS